MSIATLLLLAAAAPPVHLIAETFLAAASTSKSLSEFGTCFAASPVAAPSAFVSHGDGGRFSNEGAPGVTNPYAIRFTQGSRDTRVQVLIGARGGAEERQLLEAVERCW